MQLSKLEVPILASLVKMAENYQVHPVTLTAKVLISLNILTGINTAR